MKHYTQEHEWCVQTGTTQVWRVGITAYAQEQLGDIVHIELPKVGSQVKADDSCAVVESVKSASDINAPLTGTITAINEAVSNEPELVNRSPEEDGWLFEVEVTGDPDVSRFMDADAYAKQFPAE